jgi:hypothetical protein
LQKAVTNDLPLASLRRRGLLYPADRLGRGTNTSEQVSQQNQKAQHCSASDYSTWNGANLSVHIQHQISISIANIVSNGLLVIGGESEAHVEVCELAKLFFDFFALGSRNLLGSEQRLEFSFLTCSVTIKT